MGARPECSEWLSLQNVGSMGTCQKGIFQTTWPEWQRLTRLRNLCRGIPLEVWWRQRWVSRLSWLCWTIERSCWESLTAFAWVATNRQRCKKFYYFHPCLWTINKIRVAMEVPLLVKLQSNLMLNGTLGWQWGLAKVFHSCWPLLWHSSLLAEIDLQYSRPTLKWNIQL